MKKKVVLLAGGFSEEREISLQSSVAINKALIELGYEVKVADPKDFDSWLHLGEYLIKTDPYIVFNGLHGGEGEDGTVQAFLTLLNIPYTGSGSKASSLAMDKTTSFLIANALEIMVPPFMALTRPKRETGYDAESSAFPFVVKPNSSGSSYGVTIVENEDQIAPAVKDALRFSDKIICQVYIKGSELTVSVLGGKALPVVEIKAKDGWYDYKHKYTAGETEYIVPAKIPKGLAKELQKKSEKLFKEFGCKGYARVDYRYDGSMYYFLELNTLPGMTSLSLTPMAAKEAGISFNELIERIIQLSLKPY